MDPVERNPRLHVGAKAMLLVLREDAEDARVDVVLRDGARSARTTVVRERAQAEEELFDEPCGLGSLSLLG